MKIKHLLSLAVAFATVIEASTFALAAPYFKGDIDGDGSINSSDALTALQYSVGMTDTIDMKRADMDGNEEINSNDALLILQTCVGMVQPVEIEEEMPDIPDEPDVPPEPIIKKTSEELYVDSFTAMVSNEEIYKNMVGLSDNIGSRYYTYKGIKSAYDYLYSTLSGYGYSGANLKADTFTAKDVSLKNIYCTIPTKTANPDIIVFCAHYDSATEGKGAVDNASGVCTVLELARIMKSMNKDFGKEIRFCFLAGEEIGYYGAYRYCTYASASTSSSPASIGRHKFVLNIDMAVHPKQDKNWYLCVSTEPLTSTYSYRKPKSNYTSNSIDAAKKIVGDCGEYKYVSPVTAGEHDLLPFRKKGIDGATLSWREVAKNRSKGNDMNLASPSIIHTTSDLVKNVDMDSLYKTVRLVAATAAEVTFSEPKK